MFEGGRSGIFRKLGESSSGRGLRPLALLLFLPAFALACESVPQLRPGDYALEMQATHPGDPSYYYVGADGYFCSRPDSPLEAECEGWAESEEVTGITEAANRISILTEQSFCDPEVCRLEPPLWTIKIFVVDGAWAGKAHQFTWAEPVDPEHYQTQFRNLAYAPYTRVLSAGQCQPTTSLCPPHAP